MPGTYFEILYYETSPSGRRRRMAEQFVRACHAAQSGSPASQQQAAAFFALFRDAPSVLQDCRYVLDAAAVPPVAKFHAARLLGEIAVVQWQKIDAQSRSALRDYLFGWVLAYRCGSTGGTPVAELAVARAARTKAAHAFAVVAKREWEDLAGAGGVPPLLERWRALVAAEQDPGQRAAVAHMFLALVQEFSAHSTNTVGLSRAWHRKSREAFEQTGFPFVVQLAFDRTLALVAQGTASSGTGGGSGGGGSVSAELVAWLSLVEEAFVWFAEKGGLLPSRKAKIGAALPIIKLGARWHDIFLRPEMVQCCFAARQKLRGVAGSEALTRINSILVYFASLSNSGGSGGGIFRSKQEELGFCGAISNAAMQTAQQPLNIGSAPGSGRDAAQVDMLFVAQTLRQIVLNFGVASLMQQNNGLQLVHAIGTLVQSTLRTAMTVALEDVQQRCTPPDPHDASMEAFDCLLEAWVLILSQGGSMVSASSAASATAATAAMAPISAVARQQLQQCMSTASRSIFEAVLQFRLHIASAVIVAGVDDDDEFEDATLLESQMVSVSLAGRQNAAAGCDFLRREVELRLNALRAVRAGNSLLGKLPGLDASGGKTIAAVTQAHALLDQIWWLCHFIGYFLVDIDSMSRDTEPPLIPPELCAASARSNNMETDPTIALSNQIFALVDAEATRTEGYAGQGQNSGSSSDASLSPFLHEKLLWLLRRWARAFLMPDLSLYTSGHHTMMQAPPPSSLSPVLLARYGATSPAAQQQVGYIVTKATLLLAYWPTEPGVTSAACSLLKNVCSHAEMRKIAVASPAFAMLISAYGEATCPSAGGGGGGGGGGSGAGATKWITDGMRSLPCEVAGSLSQVICIACDASATPALLQSNLRTAAAPTFMRLQQITSHASFSSAHAEAAVRDEVLRLLHMMCGIARASSLANLTVMFDMCAPTFEGIVHLVEVYHASSTLIVAQCLSFFADLADAQCALLDPGRSCMFFNAIQALLTVYGPGKCNLTASWSLLRRTPAALAGGASQGKHVLGGTAEPDDVVTEVVLVLRVLSQLSNKANVDWYDFESTQQQQMAEQASRVLDMTIVLGLRAAVPSVTPNVLSYPKVCREYFKFLSFAVEAYPGRILSGGSGGASALGKSVSHGALAAISFGLQHHDTVVLRQCLRAIQEIAEHCAKNAGLVIGRDARRLPAGQAPQPVNSPALQELLGRLLAMLLERQNVHVSEVVGDAAGTLLALVICEQPTFARFAQQHVATHPDPNARASLAHAFQQLLGAGGVANNRIDRRNRTQFRKNLLGFLEVARGHS
jgi:hypothetical protein